MKLIPKRKLYQLEDVEDYRNIAGTKALISINGVLSWGELSGTTDELVKTDSSDSTAGYLIDKVDNITIEVDSTNHKIKVKDNVFAEVSHTHQWNDIDKSGSSIADLESKNFSDIVIDGNKDLNGYTLTNVADPTNAQDVATKAYVDANAGSGSGTDELVKADSSDPTPGTLADKVDGTTIEADTTNHKIKVVDGIYASTNHTHTSSDITDLDSAISSNSDVSANTSARHTHSNKSVLDNIINTGSGNQFLADDGSYKAVSATDELVKADSTDDTPGTLADKVDGTTIEVDTTNHKIKIVDGIYASSGHTHDDRYYTESETDNLLSGKADKVSGATNGNLAGLDTNGNLTDSGHSPSDFASASHTHDDRYYTETEVDNLLSGKASKISGGMEDNFVVITDTGDITDSGYNSSSFAESNHTHNFSEINIDADKDMGGHKFTNVADPTDAQDVATKAYVDANAGSGSGTDEKVKLNASDATAGYLEDKIDGDTIISDGTHIKVDLNKVSAPEHINDIGDVTITTPEGGEVLSYDQTQGTWINADISSTSASRSYNQKTVVVSAGDKVFIEFSNPNLTLDKHVFVLKKLSEENIEYEPFTFIEPEEKLDYDNTKVIMDGNCHLKSIDEKSLTTENFYKYCTLNLDDYSDVISIDVE